MRYKTIGGLRALTAGKENRPTLVFFHGYRANAADLYPLHQLDSEHFFWVFPEAPLSVSLIEHVQAAAWFPIDLEAVLFHGQEKDDAFDKCFPEDLSESREKVNRFLQALAVDPAHLVLGGFSQGAIVAIDTALSLKQSIAGLAILSGTLIHHKRWETLAKQHANLPFFQSHGKYDEVLPVCRAQELFNLLTKQGLAGQLHLFEGGHELPPTTLTKLMHFLFNIIE